jgi:hypothetical protein
MIEVVADFMEFRLRVFWLVFALFITRLAFSNHSRIFEGQIIVDISDPREYKPRVPSNF